MLKVLLVEDDPELAEALLDSFALAGIAVQWARDGQAGLEALSPEVGLVVSDLRMPRMDGLQLLDRVKAYDADLPMILMTGHGDIPMAVKALKDGAFDFLPKPFAADHLIAQSRRALQTMTVIADNRRLTALSKEGDRLNLLGQTPVMMRLRQTLRQIAPLDVHVLIEGETGTGKSTAARALHQHSLRKRSAFVRVDCAALPTAHAEEVLFGSRSLRGKVEEADQGSLYLTDIECLSPQIHARLLSVLTLREVRFEQGPARAVNIRLIAATKADLVEAVAQGRFHDDLYYRLETLRLRMPPLRERKEDIALLLHDFMGLAASCYDRPLPQITPQIAADLANHPWPGNVQELENYATRLVLGLTQAAPDNGASLSQQLDHFEAELLKRALERARGDVNAAALALGLPRRSLYARLQRHCIEPAGFRREA